MATEEELIQEVVSKYSSLNGNNCCSYALFSNDLVHQRLFPYEVCHMGLRWDASIGKYDQLITSYPVKDDLDLAFFDFMKNVFYSQFKDHLSLEQASSGQHFIRITGLDTIPANVVYNICICSRINVERKTYLRVWKELVDSGVHPSFAFAICRSTFSLDTRNLPPLERVMVECGVDYEHWPFYIRASLKALMTGPLADQLGGNYKYYPRDSTPTNSIWGDSTDLRGFKGKTVGECWDKWQKELVA